MILNLFLLVLGFVFLIKGADIFVDSSSSAALNFKVPKMFIGLTIVAFGTSAPELAVSIKAIALGSSDMVIGNVIGSNILNILLILGIGAMIKPIKIKDNTVKKELPICILISTLLVVLFMDTVLGDSAINQITRADGIVLILFFLIFIYYLVSLAKSDKMNQEEEKPQFKLGVSLLLIVVGLVGIVIGSNLVVNNASIIASKLGVSERIISLTIIAFGTSLPELVTTIVSSRKGEQDLLVGNIIGSNIFNICLVLGLPVALFGSITAASFNVIDLIMIILSPIILFWFSKTKKEILRGEGFAMLLLFFAYYILVFVL